MVALTAAPILMQFYLILGLVHLAVWSWRVPHAVAAPCTLIGKANFFELAFAAAISLFVLGSGAALAKLVGALVMLSLVAIANRTPDTFEDRATLT